MNQPSTFVTWFKYKEWVTKLVDDNKSYYCRGQMDPAWKLQTTLHRYMKEHSITLVDYLNVILPEVHYHISAHQNEIVNLEDPVEFGAFLALLQHHGFPTPLLDWTSSPYIAAYFALRDIDDCNPQHDYVKIYLFDFLEWTNTYQQPLDLRNTSFNFISVFRPYARHNKRIIPQQGTYTATNVLDMGEYINNCQLKTKKTFLYEFCLSVIERNTIMRELNLMGINEMTLFPGVDGICKALKEQLFSRESVALTPSEIKKLLQVPSSPSNTKKGKDHGQTQSVDKK